MPVLHVETNVHMKSEEKILKYVRFEVFTAMTLKNATGMWSHVILV
jgi:hypothetical protein